MTTLNKSDLQKFAEQSGLQVDGRSEFAYTDRLEQFSKFVRLDLELEINDLKDQLAKAEQRVAEAYRAHQHMDADMAADAINNGEAKVREGDVRCHPRVAELEAVLRECREVLVHCAGVFDEVRGYPITYDLTIEAITKIYEVLK